MIGDDRRTHLQSSFVRVYRSAFDFAKSIKTQLAT
jgi:hypothetical protein